MKTVITFTLALLISVASFGQNVIDKHFSTYKAQENFTSVHVSGKMFELAGYIEFDDADEEVQQLKDFIATIQSFNLIAGEKVTDLNTKFNSAIKKVSATHEELMRVDDKRGNFSFYIDERKGIVKEVVLVGQSQEELIIFSLMGNMNLRNIGRLANIIQQGDIAKLDMITKHGVDQVKVYPNPASAGDEITVDIPAEMIGGKATITNMQGRIVKEADIAQERHQFSTANLASGTYVISLQKDEVTINRQVVVQGK